MEKINRGITYPKGFEASGVCAGIRGKKSKNDMALLLCKSGARGAGVFTGNKVKAAPVLWDREIIKADGKFRAVIINSGIANACTGKEGYENTVAEAEQASKLLSCKKEEILICSTGVIGMQLEKDIISKGIDMLFESTEYQIPSSYFLSETAFFTLDTASFP